MSDPEREQLRRDELDLAIVLIAHALPGGDFAIPADRFADPTAHAAMVAAESIKDAGGFVAIKSTIAELVRTGKAEALGGHGKLIGELNDPEAITMGLPLVKGARTRVLEAHRKRTLEGIAAKGTREKKDLAEIAVEVLEANRRLQSHHGPRPLPPKVSQVEPFDLACLPDRLRPFVEDVAGRMSCPVEFPAVAVMVCSGAMVGRGLGIRPKQKDDWIEFPNFWGAVVGLPSSMKSPPLLEMLKPVKAREIKMGEAWAEENADSEDPAPRPRLTINDPTVEKLIEIARDNPRGLLLERDELAGWLETMGKAGREGDRQFYLEAAIGKKAITQDRIGRGTVVAKPIALSVLGGIQPGPLLKVLGNGGAKDDGLLQRFSLLVWPEASGAFSMVDRYPDPEAREAYRERLEFLRSINADGGPTIGEKDDFSETHYLRFSPEAADRFAAWITDLMNRLRGAEMPESLESHLSKFRKLVPTLALVCHLIDTTDPTEPVGMASLDKALTWARILESHAVKLYAPGGTGATEAARAILAKVKSRDLDRTFKAATIDRAGWRHLTDPKVIRNGLELLVDHEWITLETGTPTPKGGRPPETFKVHPTAEIPD